MLNFLTELDTWLILTGAVLAIRQVFVIFSAEQGRKQDLVKKLYRAQTDYDISVLIPCLSPASAPYLFQLLESIEDQEYPSTRVQVNVVCSQDVAPAIPLDTLKPNVKVWTYPKASAYHGPAMTWLIERCLASGGNSFFVFLKPEDVIKPDYFQNIIARGFDSFVMQGYVATRQHYQSSSPLASVVSLSKRLINRISNAGRYHLGLSCRLQDSGWVVKQEVLEMVPYRRGHDLDNLEYSLRLSLSNFRVTWAPNVVVYNDEQVELMPFLTECVASVVNRLRLFVRYGIPLIIRTLVRFDFMYLEEAMTVIKPPHFVVGALLVVLGIVSLWVAPELDPQSSFASLARPNVWFSFAAIGVALHLLSLVVARSRPADYLTSTLWTPVLYIGSFVALPIAIAHYAMSTIVGKKQADDFIPIGPGAYRHERQTRFNEAMEPDQTMFNAGHHHEASIRNMLIENAPDEMLIEGYADSGLSARERMMQALLPQRQDESMSANDWLMAPQEPLQSGPVAVRTRESSVIEKTVPISNGKKQVTAMLKLITRYNEADEALYQMTLSYKTVAFSTEQYRILDQAFYELEAKVLSRGLTIVTCGSCGYFYNPTADIPDAIKNTGVCLFGKRGQNVNLSTDSVTVISPCCSYHTPLEHREAIVQDWRDSMMSGASS